MDPSGSGEGNTKPLRVSMCKRWCFTYNNYDNGSKILLIDTFKKFCSGWIFQTEKGENGTPHIQGYIECINKMRWSTFKLPTKIHWETARGERAENIAYCSKDDSYTGEFREIFGIGFTIPKKIKIIKELYNWQAELCKILAEEPDDRAIYWIYEGEGNCGKSAFVKYWCINNENDSICLLGGASDIKHGVVNFKEKRGDYPRVIFVDLPRNQKVPDFSGLEEIKNGCFFSGKYEGGMCMGNNPHLVIFSNNEPNKAKLSADRWKIATIVDKSLIWETEFINENL